MQLLRALAQRDEHAAEFQHQDPGAGDLEADNTIDPGARREGMGQGRKVASILTQGR